MDIRKVKKLIEMLEDSNLNEIEIKEGEESVKLVKAGSNLSQTLVAQPAVQLPEENSISKEESQKVVKDSKSEETKKAIIPEVVAEYREVSKAGQLKFVVGSEQRQWDEMEGAIEKYKALGVDWPIWVMPVGAREEEQSATAGDVAKMAFQRGYNVAARVHVYLFGNAIGT